MSKLPGSMSPFPAILDPSLASRPASTVLSAYVQYRRRTEIKKKRNRSFARDWGDTVIEHYYLCAESPGLVEGMQVITPIWKRRSASPRPRFRRRARTGRAFTMRPVLDSARCKAPIRRPGLADWARRPGNGLTGASGANAAGEIIRGEFGCSAHPTSGGPLHPQRQRCRNRRRRTTRLKMSSNRRNALRGRPPEESATLYQRAQSSLLGGVPVNSMEKWAGTFPFSVGRLPRSHL